MADTDAEDFVDMVIGNVANECYGLLQNSKDYPPKSREDAALTKQRIWATIQGGYISYRRRDFARAITVFSRCEDAAKSLESIKHPVQGTLARIYYSKGLVYREQFRYGVAKASFTEGIRYAWKHLELYTGRQDNRSRKMFRAFSIAKALGLGLAWVHYTEGHLDLSLPLLLAAKTILSPYTNEEELIGPYIDVVYAGVLRSRWGYDPEILRDAQNRLTKSYETFVRLNHPYYRIRAAYNLALAHIQEGRIAVNSEQRAAAFARAIPYLTEMRNSDSVRQRCVADVFESRMERIRGNAAGAEDLANHALRMAVDEKDDFSKVDALIARGEARMQRQVFGGAAEDFRSAEAGASPAPDDPTTPPQIVGIARLHLTRTYLLQGDVRSALNAWRSWKAMNLRVENAFIKRLEEAVRARLKEANRDFVLSFNETDLNLGEVEGQFHQFLIRWVRDKTINDTQAIDKLGISRQTFYKWLKEGSRRIRPKKRRGKEK